MSAPLYPSRPLRRESRLGTWLQRIAGLAVTAGLGVMLGQQYLQPNKRVLSAAAAVIAIGVAWRLDFISGLGVLVLALPFPRGTVFGSTNLALILLLLVIYLLRWTQRVVPPPRRTAADAPIGALMLIMIVSFYNIPSADYLYFALQNFQLFLGTIFLYYLIVNGVNSEGDLKRLQAFQSVAVLAVCLTALWELTFPGRTMIPGWIDFRNTQGTEFNTRNVRVGSTFYDFELLADFCGCNLMLMGFLALRARTQISKLWYSGIFLLVTFILFTTVTRGPIVSLSVTGVYMLWRMRRRLRMVPVTVGAAVAAALFFGMNFYVATFTHSGNVLSRLEGTKMVGWMPDSRAGAWTEAFYRALEHPLIGHGPYYAVHEGVRTYYWPHNLYLFTANYIGFIGLGIMLWLLITFLWRTRPRVDSLMHPDFAQAYLFIAHAQVIFFMVDQTKIEYWRNPTYQFQVWLMFAMWMAGYKIAQRRPRHEAAEPVPRAA